MFFAVASSSLCILWRWFDRSNLIHGDSSTVELNNSNMLLRHIIKYGHGCWSSVPKQAGLQRCGKSCRLRWIYYLRPDLKFGIFLILLFPLQPQFRVESGESSLLEDILSMFYCMAIMRS
ncbi:hypothetical protein S83_012551, partial [Arachis hypogaea]